MRTLVPFWSRKAELATQQEAASVYMLRQSWSRAVAGLWDGTGHQSRITGPSGTMETSIGKPQRRLEQYLQGDLPNSGLAKRPGRYREYPTERGGGVHGHNLRS
jgi:hypothetical protein